MTPLKSRREFLGTTAGSAVALASGPLLAQADALPSQKVTIGIMGLSRGMQVAAALEKQPGVVIKYVCDVDSKGADEAKAQLERSGKQRPQASTDFRKILDDREVDALFCEAPNHWHGPATILACDAGKHVYVEKPCSHNPWEGEQMIAAARKHNRAVQMGVQRRSTPYYDNRIHYNWHWFWYWGNGELGNNGVHTLDLCRWGLNVDFPTVVVSSGGRYRFHDDQQTPDTHIANYEFPGGKQITWQGLSCNKHPDSAGYVSFYGDNGALSLGQFIAAIRSGDHFGLSAQIEKGHRSTLLCHLGNIAYRTQLMLKCDPDNGRVLGQRGSHRVLAAPIRTGLDADCLSVYSRESIAAVMFFVRSSSTRLYVYDCYD